MEFESEMKRLNNLAIHHGDYRARELTADEIALLKKELAAERASARSLAAAMTGEDRAAQEDQEAEDRISPPIPDEGD
jgi:hypothetical protein